MTGLDWFLSMERAGQSGWAPENGRRPAAGHLEAV